MNLGQNQEQQLFLVLESDVRLAVVFLWLLLPVLQLVSL
jgi:hypothetical protein